jgi:hypothetical protein
MKDRLQISNKTWIIIAGSILVLVILIAIIRPKKKDADLSLTSYDGTVTLTIPEVSKGDANNSTRHLVRCKLDRQKDFFKTSVVKHENYIGSIGTNGKLYEPSEKEDTGSYLFLKDDRYFLVTHESGFAMITELTATVRDGENTYYIIFPCDVEFDLAGFGQLDYSSLESVRSFEDLEAFYRRVNEDYFRVDNPYKTIYVNLIKDGEPTTRTMAVKTTETGVEVYTEENAVK